MRRGIFIAGTDTGVGKTYVAAGIAGALARRGVDVGVMKPVESGCRTRAGRMVPEDALKLMTAAKVRDPLALVNPYRFKEPLAPYIAAHRDGKKIKPDSIRAAYEKLSARHDVMIVEGAGGIMTPLTASYTYLDLARAINLPVLIVARPGLGTINHTLLTIAALTHRRIAIAGIVINYAIDGKSGLAEKTNPGAIEELSGISITGMITHNSCSFECLLDTLAKE